ncbi:SDR family oxidoreductase [Amorphus sp. 3PC139-8]|uniref:SDR family oxidoreductase n=1 Tax=Amorphus sp. 3PC139-8 TaxID=2735676 RepID=UPI00345CE183
MILEGRTVVVTGAGGGLGQEIALDCARKGATLILADLDELRCAETADVVAAAGYSCEMHKIDLGDPASIERFADTLAGARDELHGLVNNGAIATGIGGIGFRDVEIDTFDAVMRVNVRGTWLITRALAPLLIASGTGRVVNLASDTALWGAPNLIAYTASKGAVMAMTRSLARELGPDRVGVTAVAPGILTTASTDYVPQARHKLYESGRAVPGAQAPEEVVGTISFLLSVDALTLTGQTLPVNNGFWFN